MRERLASDINIATSFLPPQARQKLRKSTPIWINKSQQFGPRCAPVTGRGMCFHPESEWLIENGMSAQKCHGIELYDSSHYLDHCELWGPGGNMLHEFCHAYHATCTPQGYENPDIIKAYKDAMEENLYDCVGVHGPQGPKCKAYACTDPMEYFAELSTAFLGTKDGEEREYNKWYPFNRDQIRSHDPGAYEMLTKTWSLLDQKSL
uniref:Uncharacterized protein n=1 Tax=Ditylum brightwellii TaxID=49249 RepID=A0A7S2A6M2_9STRA